MTRKDYTKFAALFAGEWTLAKSTGEPGVMLTVRNIVFSTADIFAADNERFNRSVFYQAVFGDEGPAL